MILQKPKPPNHEVFLNIYRGGHITIRKTYLDALTAFSENEEGLTVKLTWADDEISLKKV